MNSIKKVFVCPLNWGLGHASRIVPVIDELIKQKYEVYIGGDGYALELLKQEFPLLKYIRFPSFIITYGKPGTLVLKIIAQLPKIFLGIIKEHRELKKIISSYSFGLVISDNRYGLWNKKIKTVFITHQIAIKLPPVLKFLETCIYKINRQIIKKYNQCWIPDYKDAGNNLTGDLAHKKKLPANAMYIGPLSRFAKCMKINKIRYNYMYDLLVIISGPEPQRSIFEKFLAGKILKTDYKALIIMGRPGEKPPVNISENIKTVSHLSSSGLYEAINNSKYIISRSGYSTIMDLIILKRTAILIPTPGQTEQEYLAMCLSGYFYCINQNDFNLDNSIREVQKIKPAYNNSISISLEENIRRLALSEE